MSSAPTAPAEHRQPGSPGVLGRLWFRQLDRYPENRRRAFYLGIVVLVTISLYHLLYVQFSVGTKIIRDFNMSFLFFVWISVVGNAVGAFASLVAGLADRWGRANMTVYGVGVAAVIVLVGLPNASSKGTYMGLYAILCFVEGLVLVATPALVRDFSPQLGRASAMGFWTLGPVLGSFVVTEISSATLGSHPAWETQFYIAGVAGLVLFIIALLGLRELAPAIRDQLMVSLRDRALIEARAQGLDVKSLNKNPWRQMLRLDVVGSAFAISVFLMLYYTAVGYFVVYYSTVFGYDEARANALANWYWASNAIALIIIGILSDLARVRKPFMILGAVGSIILSIVFALHATQPHTTYYTFALIIVGISIFQAFTFAPWMASFTETVERHNPAATATGLAIFGWTIRITVAVVSAFVPIVVHSATPLVDHGTTVRSIASAHPQAVAVLSAVDPASSAALTKNPLDPATLPVALGEVARQQGAAPATAVQVTAAASRRIDQLATASALDPTTLATLSTNPTDPVAIARATSEIATTFGIPAGQATSRLLALAPPAVKTDLTLVTPYAAALKAANTAIPPADLAYLSAHGASVVSAQKHNPNEWRNWWLICAGGQVLFVPFVFVMAGRWSPRKARQDARDHDRMVERELAELTAAHLVGNASAPQQRQGSDAPETSTTRQSPG